MSGGGGGIIIIRSILADPQCPLSVDDSRALREIADRSPAGCSKADWVTVKKILKKHLRP